MGLPLAKIYYFTLLTHCLYLQFSHSKLNSIKYPTNVVTLMFASMCIIALDNISYQNYAELNLCSSFLSTGSGKRQESHQRYSISFKLK